MSELNDFIDELHSNVDIVNVVSRYVKLKKQGVNFVGLCPFHHEKTPSFVVSPAKQLFHCFGCGAGGDVVKFIMMIESIDFKEAVSILAKDAGLTPPKFEKSTLDKEGKEEIKAVNNFAVDFFHAMLNENIRAYLAKRGLSNSSIEKYRFGFADENSNKLVAEAKKREIAPSLLVRAGLFKKDSEGNLRPYFFNRIIIPIFNAQGDIIAFSGRSIDGSEPKYLNSPETEVFSKSKTLYPFNFSKNSIREAKSAIVVEGYFDAIILQQEGIENVVSSMGTSFTEDQAKLIKRFADKVYFFYDNDLGGRLGAERAVQVCGKFDDFDEWIRVLSPTVQAFGEFDLNIGIVLMDENMDPHEIIIRDGKGSHREAVEASKRSYSFYGGFWSKTDW